MFDETSWLLTQAVQATTLRNTVIARNLVNVETPGFHSQNVEFQDALCSALAARRAGDGGVREGDRATFGEMLKASLERVTELQREADQAIQDLVLGGSHNLAGTLIAVEKARLSFQVLVQVRNKVLEAYQEITRMAV